MYTWDSVQAYHFDFHQARILEDINHSLTWKTPDHELKQYLIVARPTRSTNLQDNRYSHAAHNLSTTQTKVCFNGIPKKIVPAIVNFYTNAPTARANTQNVAAVLEQIQPVPTM